MNLAPDKGDYLPPPFPRKSKTPDGSTDTEDGDEPHHQKADYVAASGPTVGEMIQDERKNHCGNGDFQAIDEHLQDVTPFIISDLDNQHRLYDKTQDGIRNQKTYRQAGRREAQLEQHVNDRK